jgi:hypothetical protein
MNKLKTVLLSNALFSITTGLTAILMNNYVGSFFSYQEPIVFYILGFGLLAFGSYVAFTAIRRIHKKKEIKTISFADFGWVIGSIILLTINPVDFSFEAISVISIIAIIVLTFGLLQQKYSQ